MSGMKVINIMIGLPGCGKSTFCKENMGEGDVYISRDEVRYSYLKEGQNYFAQETNVFNEFVRRVNEAIANDEVEEIYVDATHINSSSRLKLLRRLNLRGDEEICYYFFDTPTYICLNRNRQREGITRVPDAAIKDMEARAQFQIMDTERRAYNPTEYRVDYKGEVIV